MSKTKRVVLVSDLHCGATNAIWNCPGEKIQTVLLDRWQDCIRHFGAGVDILICNGDAIDGHQRKGGDLLENGRDINSQAAAAFELLRMWKPREVFIVSGTGYHTSDTGDENEQAIVTHFTAAKIPATYTRKLNLRINGWFGLQCRHKIGSSGIPHGRMTPPMRSKTWGLVNAAMTGSAWPHLSVFGHVHYWGYAEDAAGAVMTLPCWTALGGRYGDECCDGHIDLGAVQLTIGAEESASWAWEKRLYPAKVGSRTVRR